ncbi:PmoA family protein [Arthrobacter sp. M4]|uniref:DUF6807 domain-containing protein n=1 Tax=Arthrobacter sp. M4 TaxID=218160 RepID=UPI001CDD8309|nr:PmoA family protein [Arthrobacter sp. M4]MCA4134279.1 PmoA family protein [Arthrobacter sp. M4]
MTITTATSLRWTDDGTALEFTVGDTQIVRYVYLPDDDQYESPRPYFHPLTTLGGDEVSIFRPWDHVWHKGLSWALPNVGNHNFWGGATYTRQTGYANLDNNGSMHHDAFNAVPGAKAAGEPVGGPPVVELGERLSVSETLSWLSQQGADVMAEKRQFAVQLLEDAWALLFETTMTNSSGDRLSIGSPTTEGRDNAGYGGLFWRGPRSFTGGEVLSPEGAGADALRGTRVPWLSFTGQHDGHCRKSSLTFIEDAANPGYPNQWFVRSEPFGCVGSAPFFSEVVPVPDGGSLSYRFAVVVADGASDAARATEYAATAKTALAEWASR